eukprot:SAG31_NODE_1914_length_6931_cov_6.490340_5_plen_92_part_00
MSDHIVARADPTTGAAAAAAAAGGMGDSSPGPRQQRGERCALVRVWRYRRWLDRLMLHDAHALRRLRAVLAAAAWAGVGGGHADFKSAMIY